jgi:hypothetical protein
MSAKLLPSLPELPELPERFMRNQPNSELFADPSEDGIALAFAERFNSSARLCHTAGAWFTFTGTHWRRDTSMLAFSGARCRLRVCIRHIPVAAVECQIINSGGIALPHWPGPHAPNAESNGSAHAHCSHTSTPERAHRQRRARPRAPHQPPPVAYLAGMRSRTRASLPRLRGRCLTARARGLAVPLGSRSCTPLGRLRRLRSQKRLYTQSVHHNRESVPQRQPKKAFPIQAPLPVQML